MARCKNDTLLKKIGKKAYTKRTEVTFNVLEDIDRCVRVNASAYYQVTAANSQYYQYQIPDDVWNCNAKGCRNTGTLMLYGSAGDTIGARWTIPYDATEFYAGLVTYFAYLPTTGKYTVTTSISSIRDSGMANKDTYEQVVEVTDPGFRPMVINFETTPTGTSGSGWQADEAGAIIEVTFSHEDDDVIVNVGASSFYFYDSLEDFQVNDVVKIACLTDISADLTVDASDASCFGAQYDAGSAAIEYTVTGKALTPNFNKLNPMMGKSDETTGWLIVNDERKIETTVINGTTYGYIQVPDIAADECGFIGVQLDDECNIVDAQMERVSTPVPLGLNERQYIVLDGTITGENDNGMILFNKSLAGKTVIVSYPQHDDVVKFVYSDENIGKLRVRMYVPFTLTDGTEGAYVFNNVLITSFPMSGSVSEESEFAFTVSVQRDNNGVFFEEVRKRYNH